MTDEVTDLINRRCYEFDASKTGPHRPKLNVETLFELAEANGVDVDSYRSSADNPFMRGRIRMNIGNALRGAFNHSGRLLDENGRPAAARTLSKGTPIDGPQAT